LDGPLSSASEASTRLLDRFLIPGRVAVVTGAGQGLGAASACALAEAGADVVVVARTKADLDSVADRIRGLGRRALPVVADMGDTSNGALVVQQALREFGRLDVVVNTVGGAPINPSPRPQRAFMDIDADYLNAAFHLNVTTAFALSQQAVPHLLEGGEGSIVNISSAMAKNPDRGMLHGGTTKAALSYMTKLMARDLAPRIRVNAVAPGSTRTPALERFYTEEALSAKLLRTPMRRLGTAEDIALAVLYFATPASSYVTGEVLEVDGGIDAPNSPCDLPDL
jgi:7-alpha-hydroxysteroid dehydrogenase